MEEEEGSVRSLERDCGKESLVWNLLEVLLGSEKIAEYVTERKERKREKMVWERGEEEKKKEKEQI